jgi:hypothetical protein
MPRPFGRRDSTALRFLRIGYVPLILRFQTDDATRVIPNLDHLAVEQ